MPDLTVNNDFTSINPASVNNIEPDDPNELSQGDFIELLVAQVKNQDPTKPMDPSQFMSQLTQSSMVNGINELQKSFDTLANKLSSDQSLQAANLVGRTVLLTSDQGYLSTGGSISGQLNLTDRVSEVTLKVYNTNGEQIKVLPLGNSDEGEMQFKWDGFADDGSVAEAGNYLVTAEALVNGQQQAVEVALDYRIDSININKNPDGSQAGTLLNLASGQSVSLSDVLKIK
ncbi:Flagellar basal-body rod modification protein FlgD [hydrothermal vent metagenome]|uniref:Flagellar basal-body rod modification protein FlgD n=1 Tax=hydrothermal vent metagenome TaxID=652676 RepID=A0A3B0WY77_9ZZZZ